MNNLTKRIITSALLLLIISISLFYNKYVWLFFIIIVSLILFIEFNNLTKKIWRKEKNTIFIVNISSFLFLALLILICYEIYIHFYHLFFMLGANNITIPLFILDRIFLFFYSVIITIILIN